MNKTPGSKSPADDAVRVGPTAAITFEEQQKHQEVASELHGSSEIERMDRGLSQLTTLNLEKLREQIKNKLAGPTQGSTIAQMMTDQIMAQFCVQISSVQQTWKSLKSFIGDINSELASSSALDVAGGRPINSPSANPSLDQQQLQKPAKTAVKPKQTGAEEFGSKLYNEYSKAKVQLPIGYPIDRSHKFIVQNRTRGTFSTALIRRAVCRQCDKDVAAMSDSGKWTKFQDHEQECIWDDATLLIQLPDVFNSPNVTKSQARKGPPDVKKPKTEFLQQHHQKEVFMQPLPQGGSYGLVEPSGSQQILGPAQYSRYDLSLPVSCMLPPLNLGEQQNQENSDDE